MVEFTSQRNDRCGWTLREGRLAAANRLEAFDRAVQGFVGQCYGSWTGSKELLASVLHRCNRPDERIPMHRFIRGDLPRVWRN